MKYTVSRIIQASRLFFPDLDDGDCEGYKNLDDGEDMGIQYEGNKGEEVVPISMVLEGEMIDQKMKRKISMGGWDVKEGVAKHKHRKKAAEGRKKGIAKHKYLKKASEGRKKGIAKHKYLNKASEVLGLPAGKTFTDLYKRYFAISRPGYKMVSWMK